MTMPAERTRAVLQTREFLQWVLSSETTLEVLIQAKRDARALLRHYPSQADMNIAHHACPSWFGEALQRSGWRSPDDAYRPIGEGDFEGHEFEARPSNEDELYAKAMSLAEPGTEPSALLSTCLRQFIERQSAQRLSELGRSTPDLETPPRRRSEPKT